MASDDTVIGIIIILLLLSGGRVSPVTLPVNLDWTFPVPDYFNATRGQHWRAVVSQDYQGKHYGQDIALKRDNGGAGTAVSNRYWPPGTHDGTKLFFAPAGIPVLSAARGIVTAVNALPNGLAVAIDHGGEWSTMYLHLDKVAVKEGDTVIGGQTLGTMGWSPTDPEGFRHLHFAMKYKGQTQFPTGQDTWRRVRWNQ